MNSEQIKSMFKEVHGVPYVIENRKAYERAMIDGTHGSSIRKDANELLSRYTTLGQVHQSISSHLSATSGSRPTIDPSEPKSKEWHKNYQETIGQPYLPSRPPIDADGNPHILSPVTTHHLVTKNNTILPISAPLPRREVEAQLHRTGEAMGKMRDRLLTYPHIDHDDLNPSRDRANYVAHATSRWLHDAIDSQERQHGEMHPDTKRKLRGMAGTGATLNLNHAEHGDAVTNIVLGRDPEVIHHAGPTRSETNENADSWKSVLREDLRKWVKEKWVDIGSPDGKGGYKPCGRSEGDGRKAYPKCVPASKARSMSKKEKKSAVRRKRKAESNSSESKGRSPKMIKTLKEHVTELLEKKLCARGKAAAKRKYDVYPSAYANMYASAVCSGKVTPGGKKDTNESFNSLSEAKKKRITKLHSKKYPKGTHYCATHVEHSELGIGTTITEHHAKPDKYGDIDWYDVKFVDHGIVEQVPTDHVNILLGEMHENHEHHEHEENELTEEVAKVKAPAGHHWMKQGKNEYTLMPHKGKFKPHKNGSLEAEFEIQKVHKS